MHDIDSRQQSPRRLIVLGSTGSIGCNTLDVIEHLHEKTELRFDVVGLAAGENASLLAEQAQRYGVKQIALASPAADLTLPGTRVHHGSNAAQELIDAVARPGDVVVAAMVGAAGLPAVVHAIERGCDIALANKETLVAAGAVVLPLAREHGVALRPIDSEHSAVFQCLLAGRSIDEVRRVVLTASGGPFRSRPQAELESVTVEEALNHPTWSMGAKITIDSATLMNKALEVIEAHWLFGLDAAQIEAIVHPRSIVHSFVEFVDGAVFAQLSPPDMRSPIQYALTFPDRVEGCCERLDWSTFQGLEFEPIDHGRFPALRLAWEVIDRGGSAGAVFNAANEVAVAGFLDGSIGFTALPRIVEETLSKVVPREVSTLEEVLEVDAETREMARHLIATSRPAAAYR